MSEPIEITVSLRSPGIYEIIAPTLKQSWTTGITAQDILQFRGPMNEAIVYYVENFLEDRLTVPFTVKLKE